MALEQTEHHLKNGWKLQEKKASETWVKIFILISCQTAIPKNVFYVSTVLIWKKNQTFKKYIFWWFFY